MFEADLYTEKTSKDPTLSSPVDLEALQVLSKAVHCLLEY